MRIITEKPVNNSDKTKSDLEYMQTLGDYVRSDYLYEERGNNKPYSFIHQNSLSAYLGMDNNENGTTYSSFMVKNVKKDNFQMVFETLGEMKQSNASLGFQIDYQSFDNNYKKSVIYYMDGFETKMDLPFSKDTNPIIKTFPNAQFGKVLVKLEQDAPTDWNDSVRITCFIQNTGRNSSVKFRVN